MTTATRVGTRPHVVFDRERLDARLVGGKLARLAVMATRDLTVPRFFCLTIDFFEEVFAPLRETVTDRLANVCFDEPATVRRAAANVAALFEAIELTPGQRGEILAAFDAEFSSETLVSVRASTVGRRLEESEDSGDNPFAGMSDSFLCVPREQVIDRVKQAWASGWSEKALLYRHAHDLDLLGFGVAVAIQEMVLGEKSFVLFTCNPRTAAREMVVVAGWGTGEGVVQEKVAVDHYFVNGSTHQVRAQIARKDERLTIDRARGHDLALYPTADSQRDAPCLSEDELARLVELGQKVEAIFGAPQDIEGTFTPDGRVHLLQSRPIVFDYRRMRVWTNANVSESFPGLTTPLTYSFARNFYRVIFRDGYRRLGIEPRDLQDSEDWLDRMLGFLDGRIYYCLTSFYYMHSRSPLFPLLRAHWEKMMGFRLSYQTQPGMKPRVRSWWRQAANAAVAAATVAYRYARHEHDMRAFHAWWEALVAPLRGRSFAGEDPLAVIGEFRRVWREVGNHWGITLLNDTYLPFVYGLTEQVFKRWGLADDPALLSDLLCGDDEDLRSVQIIHSAVRLAEAVRGDAGLRAAFASHGPDELWLLLERGELHPDFRAAVQRHLHSYGDRGLQELKMEQPNVRHAPRVLLASVQGYAQSELSVDALRASERAVRAAAEERLAHGLGSSWARPRIIRKLLTTLRGLIRHRENSRYCRSELFGFSKTVFRHLGSYLAVRGVLRDPSEVFYLTQDEVFGWFEGTGVTDQLHVLADLRRREMDNRQQARAAAALEVTTVGPVHDNQLTAPEAAAVPNDLLAGLGSSAGRVRGRARVVLDPNTVDELGEHAILVARETDPGWLFLMLATRGIVVERGSMLSHTAITGRKLGIPTVVGVPEATSRIPDGAWIEIDGASGTVRLLEAAA